MIEISFLFGLAIYGIIWFLCLFVILPIGVVTQDEAGDIVAGSAPSAPVRPHMLRKLLLTTILAAIIYGGGYWLFTSDILRHIAISF